MTRTTLALATVLLVAPLLGAQDRTLSLADALTRAERQAYTNRIAVADREAQAAQALQPYRGILPGVRVEAGFVRTTDPIAAFGTKLRQRAIGAADFDPATLNFPAAIGNRSAGIVLEQPLLNADAWAGRTAAGRAADAQRAMTDWTRTGTRVDVVRAYFGATLAAEKRVTLVAAERAATAHVARAQALADTGLVTRSDALLASVRGGEVTTQRLAAESDARHATRALAMLLGEPGTALTVPATLPAATAIRALVAADTGASDPAGADVRAEVRADVRAATLGANAARADAWRARALYLPRVNGFARYDWNDPTGFFANERAWTAGVMATWSPFAGASEIAEGKLTTARARAAEARREAAVANAALEDTRTREILAVALAQLEIAERAVAQSAEALRIVSRKYDGGLATISDLLEAQATHTQAQLGETFARYTLITAAAERRQALGGDPTFLTALDAAAPTGRAPGAAHDGTSTRDAAPTSPDANRDPR